MRRIKFYNHLTFKNRLSIEILLKEKFSVKDIAFKLKVHKSTVYREIKRGLYYRLESDLTEKASYSPEIAQERYENNLKAKGVAIKLGKDKEYATFLEKMIAINGYSPEATLGYIKNNDIEFKTSICLRTFYNYIDSDVFLTVTNKNLPIKRNKKRQYKRIVNRKNKKLFGESIEKRDKKILDREEFGHWEMDSVIGTKKSKKSLLVFTERLTRKEFIFLMKDRTAGSVVEAINLLERKFKNKFSTVFKTITCDNGSEFSDYYGMLNSKYTNSNRTKIYYCHPYSSFERGSNENQNKLIRRHIPKGKCFDDIDISKVDFIQKWINTYPRKIFNYRNASSIYNEEIRKIYEVNDTS